METILPFGGGILIGVILLVVSLILVAFFSSSEAALISVNKIRIRHLAEQGNPSAQSVQRIARNPDQLFATILTSENLFIIFATSIGTALAIGLFGQKGVLLATILMTVIIVIFGEITPKTLAAQNSERYSLTIARIMEAIIRGLYPLIYAFRLLPRLVGRLIGGRDVSPFVTEEEIKMLINISEEQGVVIEQERRLLQEIFAFADRVAREVMVPRTEISCVEADANRNEVLVLMRKTGHTRVPVFQESVDNIIGLYHAKDLLMAKEDEDLSRLRRRVLHVPESKKLIELLSELQLQRAHLAIVVDEHGGTAGLITLEDLLEEIVGEIRDEYDREAPLIRQMSENVAVVEGRCSVDEVNEILATGIPESEDYETLGGFILKELGEIPQRRQKLRVGDLTFTVVQLEGNRVARVRIERRGGALGLREEDARSTG